jgi:RNA polymerase sigma-70 factor, ECF subfamily
MTRTLQAFENNRARLRNLAYRLLGSVSDSDDVLQELYLRWHRADAAEIRSPDAWLTTALTRLCIDRMRARQQERDAYPGSWLPEPLCIAEPLPPDASVDLADDLSLALLVVLDRLSPQERAAFLLHDVFDQDYAEIGAILGKTGTACRQLLHRARKRLRADRPVVKASQEARRRLVVEFIEATRNFDRDSLMRLLADDATLVTDGGGKVRAALNVIYGNERIARLLLAIAKKRSETSMDKMMLVNGELGVVTYVGTRLASVLCFEVDACQISKVYRLLNPDKLRATPALTLSRVAELGWRSSPDASGAGKAN